MIVRKTLLLVSIFFLNSFFSQAAELSQTSSATHPTKLHVGERFVYQITYLGLVVGEAITEVKELVEVKGRKAYHIEVQVRSRSIIDYLYPVRDVHHSYVDAEYFHSLAYEKQLNEGLYHIHEEMTYDQEKHEAEYHSFTNGSRKLMLIPRNIQDQVSAGFWFRMQDIQPQSEVIIPVNADEKNWDLVVKTGKKETMDFPHFGKQEAVHLIPEIKFQGFFVKRGRVDGWISLNAKRLPLLMKVKVPILGSVSARLVEYSSGV